MTNPRRKTSESQTVSLIAQVDSLCPLCSNQLFYKKNKNSYSGYEIAHIYPLNPTDPEKKILSNVTLLATDVNNEDNLIPLCLNCHEKYDKPRTLEEYNKLYNLKKDLIKIEQQKKTWSDYQIEEEIFRIIKHLTTADFDEENSDIEFNIKNAKDKFNHSLSFPIKIKILNNIKVFFPAIKTQFSLIEAESPNSTVLISSQIKTYYLKQSKLGFNQDEIFRNISNWIFNKTHKISTEASEIITSYFIQECEVF